MFQRRELEEGREKVGLSDSCGPQTGAGAPDGKPRDQGPKEISTAPKVTAMSFAFLSVSAVVIVASLVLYDQWLTADQRGKSRQYKNRRLITLWIGIAMSAAFLLLFLEG